MGGTATNGRRCSRQEGLDIAALLETVFKGFYDRWMVTGSARRGKEMIGDVDIAVIPKEGFNEKLGELFDWQVQRKKGDPLKAKKVGLIDGVQVDFYLTDEEGWGAMLMFSTGSATLNIIQRQKAKKLGYLLNEKGVWKDGARVAGKTEEECYALLQEKWLDPSERS